MFRRAGIFYCQDRDTGHQESLRTKDGAAALTLLHSKNEAFRQPTLNLQIARTYLSPMIGTLNESFAQPRCSSTLTRVWSFQ